MYLKKPTNPHYDIIKSNEKIDGILSKIYTFLAIGWLTEIIGFSAEKINYSGTQFVILNSKAFPGVIYIVCLLLYAKFFFSALYFGIVVGLNNRSMSKRAMRIAWINVRKSKNISNRIYVAKKLARIIWLIWAVILFLAVFLPLIYILLFKLGVVIDAFKGAPTQAI